MRPMFSFFAAVLLLAATQAMASDLSTNNAWSRVTMGAGHTGAVFLEITNQSQEPRRLVSAETSLAERAEVHSNEMVDGVMKMRRMEEIEIPAGETVTLEPGGLHVMLFGLTQALKEGEHFDVKLMFDDGAEVTATVMVMPIGHMGGAMDGHMGNHSGSSHTTN
ncbi:hypothetical protein FHR98_003283 [Limibacillus halophilus]|uniref:Copper(I)-binding protein n=2 Tax=Limibacillus halophilus TaxID=1579333 RepID=A0A839SVZ3_9PROT|nr:hypothetical protein [Limibacillus halophilus]